MDEFVQDNECPGPVHRVQQREASEYDVAQLVDRGGAHEHGHVDVAGGRCGVVHLRHGVHGFLQFLPALRVGFDQQ